MFQTSLQSSFAMGKYMSKLFFKCNTKPWSLRNPFFLVNLQFPTPVILTFCEVNLKRTYLCPVFPLQIGVSRSLYASHFVSIGETSVLCNVPTIRLLSLYFSFAALKGVLRLQALRKQCKYNIERCQMQEILWKN